MLDKAYQCVPFDRIFANGEINTLATGGKVNLPESVLLDISLEEEKSPYLFKLKNGEKFCYCGVNQFTAADDTIEMPFWMMKALDRKLHDKIEIKLVKPPVGTYCKIQPQEISWLDITDFKAVLEKSLRSYSTLYEGVLFPLYYNENIYNLKVIQTQPENVIQIIDCDLVTDIEQPIGYEEYMKEKQKKKSEKEREKPISNQIKKFIGVGQRIDGKPSSPYMHSASITERERGKPDFDHVVSELSFKPSEK